MTSRLGSKNQFSMAIARPTMTFIFIVCFLGLLSTICQLIVPVMQKLFLDDSARFYWFSHVPDFLKPLGHPLPALFTSILLAFLGTCLTQSYYYLAFVESLRIQKNISEDVYRHAIHLRPTSLGTWTAGEVVSMLAVDVQASTVLVQQTLPNMISVLFPFVLCPFVLHYAYGISYLFTFLVLVAYFLVHLFLSNRQARFFANFKRLAAIRVGVINEFLASVRTLRQLGWVDFFEKKVLLKRQEETDNRVKMVTNGQIMSSIASSINFLLTPVFLLALFMANPEPLLKGDVISLVWLVTVVLARPLRQLPWLFTFGMDAITSMRRVQSFLDLKNRPIHFDKGNSQNGLLETLDSDVLISIRNLRYTINEHQIIDIPAVDFKKTEFVAIVGEVGSGKSVLLHSLFQDVGASFGSYYLEHKDCSKLSLQEVRSHFSYVSQEPFIMSATIRENLAFDYGTASMDPKSDDRYLEALKYAHLNVGLDIQIGEKGLNMSGGERARLALARADVERRPVFLLDDVLSALDPGTEHDIVENLLKNRWAGHLRILATHRLSVLSLVDRVIFMQSGKIVIDGNFEYCYNHSSDFRTYLEVHLGKQQSKEGQDVLL